MADERDAYQYVMGLGFQRKKSTRSGIIDFVLVCHVKTFRNEQSMVYLTTYIKNLEKNGLTVEMDVGLDFQNFVFIKVYGKESLLIQYAEIFNVNLTYQSYNYQLITEVPYKFMTTELTNVDSNSNIFQRGPEICFGERPEGTVMSERTQIVYMLLMRTRFGGEAHQFGLENLVKQNVLMTYYPLHSTPWEWSDDPSEPLNDRQLLLKYWGSYNMWYKQQPLNAINYYFGADIAYYFAFFGFFNQMLIWASLSGFICFIAGIIYAYFTVNHIVREACVSSTILCPILVSKHFQYRELKDVCGDIKVMHIFDNPVTIFFAVFMSFWATIFICLWKRHYSVLMYRWNISFDDTYESRPEFELQTPYRRVCPVTQEIEAYIPASILFANYSVTIAVCLVMFLIVFCITILLVFLRLNLIPVLQDSQNKFFKNNFNTLAAVISGTVFGTTVAIMQKFYLVISLWLTKLENPRTQEEFDSSYIYKSFVFYFVCNFSTITYVAFFKGNLYTHPGDNMPPFKRDQCHHGGCMLGLCIELTLYMLIKSCGVNLIKTIVPRIITKLKNLKHYKTVHVRSSESPQWELEYNLAKIPNYYLVEQYLELITQYGLVTFFVAAFPLGPLCALVGNLVRLRTDGYKFLRIYRRAVPFQGTRMEAFNNILKIMTFISTVSNAFVIGFTSNFVKRTIYKYNYNWELKGYNEYVLSEFSMKDYVWPKSLEHLKENNMNVTCYYHAMRNPPTHAQKYELTGEFWFTIAIRFLVVILFEHLILILNAIVSHIMPTIPHFIKKQVSYQRNMIKEEMIQKLDRRK